MYFQRRFIEYPQCAILLKYGRNNFDETASTWQGTTLIIHCTKTVHYWRPPRNASSHNCVQISKINPYIVFEDSFIHENWNLGSPCMVSLWGPPRKWSGVSEEEGWVVGAVT